MFAEGHGAREDLAYIPQHQMKCEFLLKIDVSNGWNRPMYWYYW